MEAAQLRVLRGIVSSFYASVDRPVVFDKSRGWTGNSAFAELLIERRPRIIVCVRDVRDILAGLERLRQRNLLVLSPQELARPDKWDTIEGRCETWFAPGQLVGKPFRMIREALAQGRAGCLHFVNYVQLTSPPAAVLKGIYDSWRTLRSSTTSETSSRSSTRTTRCGACPACTRSAACWNRPCRIGKA